ncbi:D-aminoacid aminotransferase-like PLP-dependent enzyme [Trichoderma ceciliae]
MVVIAAYKERLAALQASSNPFADCVAWIAGELSPLVEARIPIVDRGFLYGDLYYDVPSVWDGEFFCLDDHITWVDKSCRKLRLKLAALREGLKSIFFEMVAKSGMRDSYVELVVTRGFMGPEDIVNKLYIILPSYVWLMDPDSHYEGGSAIIARTNLQWGDMVRGMYEARDRGANYPFLTDDTSNLIEGSGHNNIVNLLLHGITRKAVMEVARAKGIEGHVEMVPVEMAYTCDEIFMCTTAGGVIDSHGIMHFDVFLPLLFTYIVCNFWNT